MAAQTTKVNVPKEVGDEIVVRYAGDDPITYKVTDGHVTVQTTDVERFLAAVPGSEAQ